MGYLQLAFHRIWFQSTRDQFWKSIRFSWEIMGPYKEEIQHCTCWVWKVILFWFQNRNQRFWVFYFR